MAELFDILAHQFSKVENIDVTAIDPDWLDLITLATPTLAAGTYQATASIQFHINSVNTDLLYQFSEDGGANWGPVYMKRIKGKDNIEVLEVIELIELAADTALDIRCRVAKSADEACEITKGYLMIERKR